MEVELPRLPRECRRCLARFERLDGDGPSVRAYFESLSVDEIARELDLLSALEEDGYVRTPEERIEKREERGLFGGDRSMPLFKSVRYPVNVRLTVKGETYRRERMLEHLGTLLACIVTALLSALISRLVE